ncbi:MAG: alpha/beta hydrolase [Heyndrickxia sp.]
MQVNHFEVNRDGLIIRGIMTKPDGNGPFPALIYNHGFTGNKAEAHFLFKKIAEALAEFNYASFRFDFIGSGESDGKFIEMNMSSEMKDCLAVLQYVENLSCIDSNQMNLLGFSMGGAVAIKASSVLQEKVKKLVLLCPAANMIDVVSRSVKMDLLSTFLERGIVDFSGNVVGESFIHDIFQQDIYEMAKSVTAKVLLIHGTNDDAVPPLVSWKLSKLFSNVDSLQWIHGSDHCFSTSDFEKQVISAIKDFLKD